MPTYNTCNTPSCMKRKDLDSEGYCPNCSKRRMTKKSLKEPEKCIKCDLAFNDDENEQCIQCEVCEEWVHAICIDIQPEMYKVLFKKGESSLRGFKWFCEKCDRKIEDVIVKMTSLETKTKHLESDMEIIKNKVEKLEGGIKTQVKDEIAEVMEDKEEIEWRKYNLVIFGLPESKLSVKDDRIDEDTRIIKDIIKHDLNVGLSPRNGIYDAKRLGTFNGNKTRPVRITFDDINTKRQVLKDAKTLKQNTNPMKRKLFINPDLTKQQRKDDEDLRKKMWDRRENHNENVVIRKGKLVTVPFEVRKTRTKPSNTSTNEANSSHKDSTNTQKDPTPNVSQNSDIQKTRNTVDKPCPEVDHESATNSQTPTN